MRHHAHTTAWDSHLILHRSTHEPTWFQRLCQWLTHQHMRRHGVSPATLHQTWDAARERFTPATTKSAVDHEMGRRGLLDSTALRSAIV